MEFEGKPASNEAASPGDISLILPKPYGYIKAFTMPQCSFGHTFIGPSAFFDLVET
jgi:hypothetical protein